MILKADGSITSKGSLASAGAKADSPTRSVYAGAEIGSVKYDDANLTFNIFEAGAGAKLNDKSPPISTEVEGQKINTYAQAGQLGFGAQLVFFGIQALVNPAKIIIGTVHAVGALFEYTRAADEQVPLSPDKKERFTQYENKQKEYYEACQNLVITFRKFDFSLWL